MCGRFAILLPPDAMAGLFGALPANDLPVVPNFNVCPTNRVHVVWSGEGRRLGAMRWGFIPHWYKSPTDGPLLINARAETIAEKPAFRAACRQRRCLIPASGFFEWSTGSAGEKLPWYITRADGAPVVFAGVWQQWGDAGGEINTCAIVTTRANNTMRQVHHRMPVTIEKADWALWLGEKGKGAARLMQPADDDAMVLHRVSPDVNSNRAEGPSLIEPL